MKAPEKFVKKLKGINKYLTVRFLKVRGHGMRWVILKEIDPQGVNILPEHRDLPRYELVPTGTCLGESRLFKMQKLAVPVLVVQTPKGEFRELGEDVLRVIAAGDLRRKRASELKDESLAALDWEQKKFKEFCEDAGKEAAAYTRWRQTPKAVGGLLDLSGHH